MTRMTDTILTTLAFAVLLGLSFFWTVAISVPSASLG